MERKWVANPADGTLSMYLYPYTGMPNWEVVPEPNDGLDRWDTTNKTFIRHIDPLNAVTVGVKSLPVALRTDADFGTFVNQCLLAIDHSDMESLGFLLNNSIAATPDPTYKGFRTTQPEYIQLFTGAKQLFNV